jgi:hypothetical protein
VLVLKDGSMLVSDDHNGAVYRSATGDRCGRGLRPPVEVALLRCSTLVSGGLAAIVAVLVLAATASGASIEERLGACLACHGPGGQSVIPETPSLGGQPSFFVVAPALPVPGGPAQ